MSKITKALKLAKKHPAKKVRHGDHVIENVPYLFDLSEEEVKLLETTGPKFWIKEVDKKGVNYKVEKKNISELDRLRKDAEEMGIKVLKKDTVETLEKKILEKINE